MADKLSEILQQRTADSVKTVMNTRQGRRFIYELISVYHAITFVQGEPDTSAYNQGRRSVGKDVLDLVDQYAPEMYILMLTEAKEDEHHDSQHRSNRDTIRASNTSTRSADAIEFGESSSDFNPLG